MPDDRAVAVPLAEQLRSVPRDAVLRIDTPNALGVDTRSIPVGRLCHEAADALGANVVDLRSAATAALAALDNLIAERPGVIARHLPTGTIGNIRKELAWAIAQARNPGWHDAVLAECFLIEGGYIEADPASTVRTLIDWHVRNAAAGVPPPQGPRVLNALEVLERMDYQPGDRVLVENFLRILGERGMWIIDNTLYAAGVDSPEGAKR